MAREKETLEVDILDPESLIREYREKIQNVIEKESSLLKEKAEQESKELVARAKEEAYRIVARSKKEAAIESDQIISRAKEEAEQIEKESHEQSARAIEETKKKLALMITEVMEQSVTQAQEEIGQAVSGARTSTSRLLSQINQGLEQIVYETGARVKADLERLSGAIGELETELSGHEEPQPRETDIKAQQIKETETEVKPPIVEKTRPVVPPDVVTSDTRDKEAQVVPPGVVVSDKEDKEDAGDRLFEGSLTLEIVSPFGQEHEGDLPGLLSRNHSLKVSSAGSYTRSDRRITKYTLDLEKPLPLLKILDDMPQIKDITENKGKIEVTLK